jgi:hypothetical protein
MQQLEMFDSTANRVVATTEEASVIDAVGSQGSECCKLFSKEKKKSIRKANAAQLMKMLREQEFRCALSGIE